MANPRASSQAESEGELAAAEQAALSIYNEGKTAIRAVLFDIIDGKYKKFSAALQAVNELFRQLQDKIHLSLHEIELREKKGDKRHWARSVREPLLRSAYDLYCLVLFVARHAVETIDKKVQIPDVPSFDQRVEQLRSFIEERGTSGLPNALKSIFPEVAKSVAPPSDPAILPKAPPATWKEHKQPGETPPSFVRRVYGEWLGKGFTRATLRHLDPPLAQAMTNWLRHNQMPADVDLPTLKEQNTRWVERIETEGLGAVLPKGTAESVLREARRLASAERRRSR